ncbi:MULTISPECIES: type VII secretion protein EccB [Streptomyces]|uniref:type VII secretion protein EccB n=1 Tax=Streptomyces TaxID=1883 RepID=UPI00221F15C5|nr:MULTISPECIES: type VII secretion protein EccB [Streptomyces]
MATTREQADAYAYENRRRTTTLIRGADEARQDPRRRLNRALGGGVAFGVLIMAGFGIAGWLGGGRGPDLPDNGAVVVGDGGDRYVVNDGVVHPALNLASALLVAGGDLTEVRQSTLDEAPRGLPVGIPGAPDALPDADELTEDDWTLCAIPAETGGPPTHTALYLAVPGVAAEPETEGGATVLVEGEGGELWLLAEGRRFALAPGIRDLLGLQQVNAVPLPRQIIATVPEGPAVEIPEPGAGAGQPPSVPLPFDALVGDLAHTESGGAARQFYLVRPEGLVTVSPLLHTLLSAEAGADHAISLTDAARAPRADEPAPGDRAWPDALPRAEEPGRDQPVCVSTPPGGQPGDAPWQAVVHLPDALPEPADLTPVTSADGERLGLLDAVWLPPGSGAVVRATTSAGTGGTFTLVTDSGTAYPFASPDAVERLGYRPDDAPSVPQSYVGLLPTGPVLDPQAAAREQRGASGGVASGGGVDGGGALGLGVVAGLGPVGGVASGGGVDGGGALGLGGVASGGGVDGDGVLGLGLVAGFGPVGGVASGGFASGGGVDGVAGLAPGWGGGEGAASGGAAFGAESFGEGVVAGRFAFGGGVDVVAGLGPSGEVASGAAVFGEGVAGVAQVRDRATGEVGFGGRGFAGVLGGRADGDARSGDVAGATAPGGEVFGGGALGAGAVPGLGPVGGTGAVGSAVSGEVASGAEVLVGDGAAGVPGAGVVAACDSAAGEVASGGRGFAGVHGGRADGGASCGGVAAAAAPGEGTSPGAEVSGDGGSRTGAGAAWPPGLARAGAAAVSGSLGVLGEGAAAGAPFPGPASAGAAVSGGAAAHGRPPGAGVVAGPATEAAPVAEVGPAGEAFACTVRAGLVRKMEGPRA